MHLKRIRIGLLALLLIAAYVIPTGCTRTYDSGHSKDGKIIIGFSMDTLKEERWYQDRDIFKEEVKKLGGQTIVEVAYDSDSLQLSQVRDMLNKKIDVLVIIPHDADVAAQSVRLAKSYGVKVISYDRLIKNANTDLYISFDNIEVGKLMASTILKVMPAGNYVIIDGPTSDYNTVMISQGIRQVLNPCIKGGTIGIVKEKSTTDWMADEASDCIAKLVQDGVKFNAVIAENDSLAGGVINTLSENRLVEKIPVVGMDADLAACQRVVEGQQLMTVYKPISKLAEAAATYAVMMAKDQKIDVRSKISDGKYNVPYYAITPIAVTKDNMMGTVIKDNFHTMKEVYINIPRSAWPAQ